MSRQRVSEPRLRTGSSESGNALVRVQIYFIVFALGALIPRFISAAWSQDKLSIALPAAVDIPSSSQSGDVLFHFPIGAVRFSNGTIAIADAHGGSVRFVKPDGRLVASYGREGDGPGEFRHIAWFGQCGTDVAYVWDQMRRNMTVLTPEGTLQREFKIPVDTSIRTQPVSMACGRDGKLVLQPIPTNMGRPSEGNPVMRGTASVAIIDPKTRNMRFVRDVNASEMVVFGGGGGFRPLGKRTVLAVAPDGFYIGTADTSSLDFYDFAGKKVASVATGANQIRATRGSYEKAVEAIVASVAQSVANSIKERLLQIPMPTMVPPYFDVFVNPQGLIWLTLSPPGLSPTRFRVIDRQSGRNVDVSIARPLRLLEVGRDYLLGTYESDDGEPHIAVYTWRGSP